MKNLIYLIALCLLLSGATLFLNENEVKVDKIVKSSLLKIQKTKNDIIVKPFEANSKVKKVLSVEEIESDLFNNSDEEIKHALEQNEEWVKDKGLITKANAGDINEDEKQDLLKYIRMNTALNKILLERQLAEFESERL